MAKQESAGILLYNWDGDDLEVFLVHPGGPFWKNKDKGVWSIPKGEIDPDEDILTAAQREFEEETGLQAEGPFIELPSIKQKGGKVVHAFACEGECDPDELESNTFKMEWPPKSGEEKEFPEVDRAEWFDMDTAKDKINPSQVELLEALEMKLNE